MKTDAFKRPPVPGKGIPFPRWAGVILTFVACLVIPAAVTMALCHSRLTLTRNGGPVSAAVEHLIFFGIPYRTDRLTGVTMVESTKIEGDWIRRRSGDRRRPRREMDNGVLVLTGTEGDLRIGTDPATGPEKEQAITAFLADPGAASQKHYLMGNRLFGYLFGIPATLLAALYVVGCTLEFCHRLFGFPKRPKPWTGKA